MSKDNAPSNSSSNGGGFVFPSNTQIRRENPIRNRNAVDAINERAQQINFSKSDRTKEANSKGQDRKR